MKRNLVLNMGRSISEIAKIINLSTEKNKTTSRKNINYFRSRSALACEKTDDSQH